MISGQDILCISSIDWDFVWQGHQEIMATLAEHGNRVLFMENTGVRPPRFRDLSRLRHRILNWWGGTMGFHQERKNLFVYSPLILPFPYSRVARWINRTLLLRSLRRWMRATGFHTSIIWTFLPTPLAMDLIRALDPQVTVYYCVDDFSTSSAAARRIRRSETQLVREADLVFATSEQLREWAARHRDLVHLFPFSVNYREFEKIRESSAEVPEDLREIPSPVVGYVGGVHQWIDQDLLATVAYRMPGASFALIGPHQTDVSKLTRCPNVHLLGARPHADMPHYIKGFDVGIVPYRFSKYTAHGLPTKLKEYLAMGIPVVATDLPGIRRFNAEYGEVVRVAGNAEAFAAAVQEALKDSSPAENKRRIEVARQNSWESGIARMSGLIDEALRTRQAASVSWEETLRGLYRTARQRLLRVAGMLLVSYLVLFHTPIVWFLAEPLRLMDQPRPVSAIVVFAGGVGESGKAGEGYQERVRHSVELFRSGYADHLIFSSGFTYAFKEAEVMKALAVSLGVPGQAIILEEKATSTYQNVRFVEEILKRYRWDTILLVSSPYHMRRAALTFKKNAPEVDVVYTPIRGSLFYRHSWGPNLEQIRAILHEYMAIVYYWLKGWI